MVLLHGFGANTYTWRYLARSFPSGIKTYAIDLKGFGQSAKPADGAYSMHDQAALVEAFIDHHRLENVSLVGHSMGGCVALLVALRLQAAGRVPTSLVLIDSVAFPQPLPCFIALLRCPVVGRLAVHAMPETFQVRTVLRSVYYDRCRITEDAVEAYAAPLRTTGAKHALVETALRIVPDDVDAITGRYAGCTARTLVVWGSNDRIVPLAVGQKLSQALPNATLRIIDRCGHAPHEEAPEQAIPVIVKFLA